MKVGCHGYQTCFGLLFQHSVFPLSFLKSLRFSFRELLSPFAAELCEWDSSTLCSIGKPWGLKYIITSISWLLRTGFYQFGYFGQQVIGCLSNSVIRSRRLFAPAHNRVSGRKWLQGFFHNSAKSVAGLAFLRVSSSQHGCHGSRYHVLVQQYPKMGRGSRAVYLNFFLLLSKKTFSAGLQRPSLKAHVLSQSLEKDVVLSWCTLFIYNSLLKLMKWPSSLSPLLLHT